MINDVSNTANKCRKGSIFSTNVSGTIEHPFGKKENKKERKEIWVLPYIIKHEPNFQVIKDSKGKNYKNFSRYCKKSLYDFIVRDFLKHEKY